jgi:mannose-6-phosphate isomerase-like protein (cupin superfamily)
LYIKRLAACGEIHALDGTRLRELLHPDRDPVATRYSLALARLGPGEKSLPHRLEQSEVYYLLAGAGTMHIGDESAAVTAGDAVYIPPGSVQWLDNHAEVELEFICIVDPPWAAAGEEKV